MSSTNFERFKQKMEAKAKKPSSTNQFTWMKLENGKRYNMRFLPLKSENLELPIAMYHHHALTFPDGHFESISCPKKTEEGDCPFCNHASLLYRKFTKTEKPEFKEAAKQLFVKTHYLLVGYEKSELDVNDIKPEDIKIVRASSKANMDLIEAKLSKEVDFVDFQTGRDIEIVKNKPSGKNTFPSITWDFGDPTAAFDGKSGKRIWDELIEKSPDLSSIVAPMASDKLQEKFNEFMSAPVTEDDDDEADRKLLAPVAPRFEKKAEKPVQQKAAASDDDDLPFDIESMRQALED